MKNLIVSAFALLQLSFFVCTNALYPQELLPISLKTLRAKDEKWNVLKVDTIGVRKFITLQRDLWFMYFLHWRPLTSEKESLSTAYLNKLMLNFWGPNMPFTLTGKTGELSVAGHPAYFIDGTIYKGSIHTRFIVWNCSETKRQFIADCNINVSRGTPQEILELEKEVALTTRCHDKEKIQKDNRLSREYISKEFGFSFWIPEDWRTSEYRDSVWFPDGLSPTNGTLWTLPSDSRRWINLFWQDGSDKLSEANFKNWLEQTKKDSLLLPGQANAVSLITSISPRKIEVKESEVIGEGEFTLTTTIRNQIFHESFIFKASLWTHHHKTYFLISSMVAYDAIWRRAINLRPSKESFEKFYLNEVLPSLQTIRN